MLRQHLSKGRCLFDCCFESKHMQALRSSRRRRGEHADQEYDALMSKRVFEEKYGGVQIIHFQ